MFYAEVLKIYANGNDMTSRINNAANLSYVKEIYFISDSARKYIINGSVDFQGKTIVVGNGCILSGSGTVSNA